VAGSHGGEYSGRWALAAGLAGVIFHDAGLGLDRAGVAGLALLDQAGVAAAAVAAASARIGDGQDVFRRGVIAEFNQAARRGGIRAGLPCRQAADLLLRLVPDASQPAAAAARLSALAATAPGVAERVRAGGRCDVWILDSASEAGPRQDGAIVVTGSHGGLPGGQPRRALKCDALLAAFNAAGGAAGQPGVGRLPVLDDRGIAAVAVDAMSARIGSAASTLAHGVVSVVNQRAASAFGIRPGDRLSDVVDAIAGGAVTRAGSATERDTR
jgi:hypothetical protein